MAFRPVAPRDLADLDPMGLQVPAQGSLLEGLDAQAEVVHVARDRARTRIAAAPAWQEVDQGGAGAQLHHADALDPALLPAAQDIAVEAHGARRVGDAQHDMVEALEREGHGRPPFRAGMTG